MKHTASRVLFISPFFSPLAHAEAFCGGKLALHLLDAGIDLTVLNVDYAAHSKFSVDTSALWSRLTHLTVSFSPAADKPKLLSFPLGLCYQTLEWARWISAAVTFAWHRHLEQPFDVIYSRGLPNFAHVSAYWISRRIGRPWIANFNDPWDLEATHLLPQHRHLRRRTAARLWSELWLRRTMRTADILTFPCDRLRDYHVRLVRPRGECRVIPHIGHRVDSTVPSKQFRMVHAGNLGSGESTRRNATRSLLRGLRLFFKQEPGAAALFRFVLVGSEDSPTIALARELNLEANLVLTGRVMYEESLRQIADASVCLLVEGIMPEGIYLPSKFPDYIAAGKPVIALSPITGTIADLQPTRGITIVPVNDECAIAHAISKHYEAFKASQMGLLEPSEELRWLYSGTRIGSTITDLFKQLSNRV